jgi:hypothetical protein
MNGQSSTATNIIQRMPAELQLIIFEYLDYQSAIRLWKANRHFRHILDPQRCLTREKLEFVQRADIFLSNLGFSGVKHVANGSKVSYSHYITLALTAMIAIK